MSHSTLTVLEPTEDSLGRWLQSPGFRKPLATVLHHCYSPSAAQYRGRQTIVGVRQYHVDVNGWHDIGAEGYACPDRTVVTGRPLDEANWCHAAITRVHPEAEAWAISGGVRQWFNRNAFGLETVANFDKEDPYGDGLAARSYQTALKALAVVHRLFGIPVSRLFFHRDVADKTCPGKLLTRTRVRTELASLLAGTSPDLKVVVCIPGQSGVAVDCKPEWVGEHITVEAAPLLAAMDTQPAAVPAWVIHDNGRCFAFELDAALEEWLITYKLMAQGPRLYVCKVAA